MSPEAIAGVQGCPKCFELLNSCCGKHHLYVQPIRYMPVDSAAIRWAAWRHLRVSDANRSRIDWVRTQRAAIFSDRTFLHPPHRTRRASFPCTRLSIILHPIGFLEFHFVLMDAFCSMFFDMTVKAYRF